MPSAHELSVCAAHRGLKWDSNGEVNYDTDMNVVGGDLLAGGTMCQPADTLLGAMNPYKTQAAATPIAMAEAAAPSADNGGVAGPLFVEAATAYAIGGGTLTAADAGYAEAVTPFVTEAVTARVGAMVLGCKPTDPSPAPCASFPDGCGVNANLTAMPWCKYDFLPDVEDSGSCGLQKTWDMFADPPFPGLPWLILSIPAWLTVLIYLVMECTSIKDSCAMDTDEKEEEKDGADAKVAP